MLRGHTAASNRQVNRASQQGMMLAMQARRRPPRSRESAQGAAAPEAGGRDRARPRWGTAQVRKNLPYHCRIMHSRNQPQSTSTVRVGQHVNGKRSLHQGRPGPAAQRASQGPEAGDARAGLPVRHALGGDPLVGRRDRGDPAVRGRELRLQVTHHAVSDASSLAAESRRGRLARQSLTAGSGRFFGRARRRRTPSTPEW